VFAAPTVHVADRRPEGKSSPVGSPKIQQTGRGERHDSRTPDLPRIADHERRLSAALLLSGPGTTARSPLDGLPQSSKFLPVTQKRQSIPFWMLSASPRDHRSDSWLVTAESGRPILGDISTGMFRCRHWRKPGSCAPRPRRMHILPAAGMWNLRMLQKQFAGHQDGT
jgi:hypothetical protein